jgi:hypothetical protein
LHAASLPTWFAKAYSGDRAQAQGLVPDARNAVRFPAPPLARGYAADDMYVKADARMSPARVVCRKLSAAISLASHCALR